MWEYFFSTHSRILIMWCRTTGLLPQGFLITKYSSLLGCYTYLMMKIWLRFERVWWRHRQHKAVLPDPGQEGATLLRNVRNHLSNKPERLNLQKPRRSNLIYQYSYVLSATQGQRPNLGHNFDRCCKEFRVTTGLCSVLHWHKVKPDGQVRWTFHDYAIWGNRGKGR